jgi:hypothetical protein
MIFHSDRGDSPGRAGCPRPRWKTTPDSIWTRKRSHLPAYDAQHWRYGYDTVNGVPQPCNYQDVTVTYVTIINQP